MCIDLCKRILYKIYTKYHSSVIKIARFFNQIKHYTVYIFSSPEHKVGELLWPAFVRCVSSVMHIIFYLNIFSFWNRSLDFDQTSQEWSLGGPLPKLFKLYQLVA